MSQTPTQNKYKAGDIIIRQGDKGDRAYIIEEGRVEIVLEKQDRTTQSLGTRGVGAMIGEMALIDQAPRSATIKAIEDCKLQEITHEDFVARLDKSDPILRMATQVILTRYRDTLTRAEIAAVNQKWALAEAMEQDFARDSEAYSNVKIANDFKHSLAEGHIQLNYQPIIDLSTQKVMGFEALMRWLHPEHGFISPAKFIPVLEDSGFIVNATRWALEEALQALKRISAVSEKPDLFMSVNFSSHDFASDGFTDNVLKTLKEHDVKPSLLHMEITERLLMDQPDKAKNTLQACKDAGIDISIDDFGTGYSSLSYLHHFPIDILKIDLSFVKPMLEDKSMMELVKTIITLGQNMGMKIIAEGVETAEHATALHDLGCEFGQGYHFAKPMPELEAADYTHNH